MYNGCPNTNAYSVLYSFLLLWSHPDPGGMLCLEITETTLLRVKSLLFQFLPVRIKRGRVGYSHSRAIQVPAAGWGWYFAL